MLIPFRFLPTNKIRGIIHVGAHECEELDDYINDATRSILWIEANPEKAPIIEKNIKNIPGSSYAIFAAGSHNETCKKLKITNNGLSSSLLEFGTHQHHHPSVNVTKEVDVQVKRIDTYLLERHINMSDYNMICLDIQGYELEALRGASRILEIIDFIYVEVNTEKVYKDCATLGEIESFLRRYGFSRTWLVMTRNGWGDAFYSKGNKYMNKVSFASRLVVNKLKRGISITSSQVRISR